MTRRCQDGEVEFGSDSFLDIIANIVGILIILIVIAGVRVSRQPLGASGTEPAPTAPPVVLAVESESESEEKPERILPVPVSPLVPVAGDDPEPDEELPHFRLDQQQRAIDELDRRAERLTGQLASLSDATATAQSELARRQSGLGTSRATVLALREAAEADEAEAAQIQAEIAESEREQVNVEQIEHRVTPVGRDVTGKELHFRISNGRVAYVPVDELLSDLREQARRHQSWLLQHASHQGVVGPIRGFRMSYTVTRKSASLQDELRYGGGVFRVIVSQWKIETTPNVESETASQAARPGSLFATRLLQAGPDDTITFWVYPDSFGAFREFQKIAHAEGFAVAGRPLPEGVPIAGSPNGTRSAGQ